jgi:hypothetical protein
MKIHINDKNSIKSPQNLKKPILFKPEN